MIATANSQRQTFEEKMAASGKVQTGYVLLWSFSDPIHPQFVLEAPADVYCFRFCPSNPDVVVGGLASGQVVMWDLAEAREAHKLEKALTDDSSEEGGANTICAQAKIFSAVDHSHKRTVTDLQWLPPSLETGERNKFVRKLGKQQDQFLTIAGDGQLLVWDVRRAREVLEQELGKPKGEQEEEKKDEKKKKDGWGPSLKMPLTHPDSGNELAATSLILDVPPAEDAACRMFTVTEDGEFVTVGLLDPQAENQAAARGARTSLNGHFGPCTGMMRSPFVPDVYLSVGDWSFNLWKDGGAAAARTFARARATARGARPRGAPPRPCGSPFARRRPRRLPPLPAPPQPAPLALRPLQASRRRSSCRPSPRASSRAARGRPRAPAPSLSGAPTGASTCGTSSTARTSRA